MWCQGNVQNFYFNIYKVPEFYYNNEIHIGDVKLFLYLSLFTISFNSNNEFYLKKGFYFYNG